MTATYHGLAAASQIRLRPRNSPKDVDHAGDNAREPCQ